MKNLCMIACISRDRGLGKDGKLLWNIPEDMQFFKQTTMGHPVIMGRKTFESIGRALPGRENVVLSRSKGNGAVQWCDETELETWMAQNTEKKFIIGGASLYEKFLPEAEVIYLTEVNAIKSADTYFPEFDKSKWQKEVLQAGRYDGVSYKINQYTRKDGIC